MSYDMSLGEENFNYTYNVSKMWYAAIPETGIRTHYGMTGREAVEPLKKIFTYMLDNMNELKKFEPENGWGSYQGALQFVLDLILASLQSPDEIWSGD